MAMDSKEVMASDGHKSSGLSLVDLPNEIITKIFNLISFTDIAKNRVVCRRFNEIGSQVLNREFQKLRNYTQQRFQTIKSQMPRRESARRKHPLARESDIIETLHMRLTLLQMTFSKHIERMHCCFFSGEILDEVHRIIRYVRITPVLSRAYKVTDELFDLSTMAMEYFKEHIEPTLPEINYFGVADYLLDYSPTLTGSPQTQLSLMDNTTKDIHNSNRKKTFKTNSNQMSSSSSSSTYIVKNSETTALKKRLRAAEMTIKRNNNQIQALKREVTLAKKRWSQQQRVTNNMRSRFDEYDKKFETTNRKLSAVLEELSKCKTELQYWRSTSPSGSTPTSNVKPNTCRCNDGVIEGQQLLVPEVFKPIEEKQPTTASHISQLIDNNHTNDLPLVQKVEEKLCKRKLNYFEDNSCEKKCKKS
ncbi:F-box only protein 28-like [Oppia nitens]|uniref:F-box only protein 28-like n=1 Tax=Oppia nitens TaxID=1686743 RepID=UPI0023DBEB85|nr:F-box only protein 28-like [Oppia nitens]